MRRVLGAAIWGLIFVCVAMLCDVVDAWYFDDSQRSAIFTLQAIEHLRQRIPSDFTKGYIIGFTELAPEMRAAKK